MRRDPPPDLGPTAHEDDEGRGEYPANAMEQTDKNNFLQTSAPARQDRTDREPGPGQWLLESLRRRHEAAKRLPPLNHSGQRDPLSPRERTDGWLR